MTPDLAAQLAGYDQLCVPNLADVAARTGCLVDSDGACPSMRTAGPALQADAPLAPGDRLQSAGGGYVAVFQSDGDLAVYPANATNSQPLWHTATQLTSARPGVCAVGALDGIVKLYPVGGGVPYWTSSAVAAPPDQAPYRLVLGDDGVLRVWGRFGAAPVWSSADSTGVPFMITCEDAGQLYASLHAQELARPENVGLTPWAHFQQFGRVYGWVWPGPACA
jgi:hypothetical protein